MPVETEGFLMNDAGTTWRLKAEAEVGGTGRGTHSEITVINDLGRRHDGPYLIKQNAFPCAECDAKFEKSRFQKSQIQN